MNMLSRLSILSLAVALLLSVFLLPGCGKTDDPSAALPTSSATTTTKTEETSAGNADTTTASRKMVAMLLEELNSRLGAQYGASWPDTYAGAYNDTTALVICVTDEAAGDVYRALLTDEAIRNTEAKWLADTGEEAEKWASHAWVHYATVEYSLNELQAVKDKLNKMATEWNIADMAFDIPNNRLTVELNGDNDDKKAVLAALDEREAEMVHILFHLPA